MFTSRMDLNMGTGRTAEQTSARLPQAETGRSPLRRAGHAAVIAMNEG